MTTPIAPPENMRGILLAGGLGTRLRPLTQAISKQLLPVYDKPLIYYPLSTLMLTGIREVMIITAPDQKPLYEALLGDGSQFGMRLEYKIQDKPSGIADALILGEDFLQGGRCALALGDNILHTTGLTLQLRDAAQFKSGAVCFAHAVRNPSAFGVAEFDASGRVIGLVEKPEKPRSEWAVTGLYFYDSKASEYARNLEPSQRGELEITDLNRVYLEREELRIVRFGRGTTWLDTGTLDGLVNASEWVRATELRQGLKISVPEEIAWRNGWIDSAQLADLGDQYPNDYGTYLKELAQLALARDD